MCPLDPNYDAKLLAAQSDEGFFESIVADLKSLPDLPDALVYGLDHPNATPEQNATRRRALATAAQYVLPALVSGGVGAMAGRAALPPLIAAITEAVGWGGGSSAAAYIKTEDEGEAVKAGLFGAALGGVAGGVQGLLSKRALAGEASKIAEETATPLTKAGAKAPPPAFFGESTPLGAPSKASTQEFFSETAPTGRLTQLMDQQAATYKEAIDEGRQVAAARMANYSPDVQQQLSQVEKWLARSPLTHTTPPGGMSPESWADLLKVAQTSTRFSDEELSIITRVRARMAVDGVTPTETALTKAPPKPTSGPFIAPPGTHSAKQVVVDAVKATDDFMAGETTGKAAKLARPFKGKRTFSGNEFFSSAGLFLSSALESARTTLKRMGPAGVKLAEGIDEAFTSFRQKGGLEVAEVDNIFKGMTLGERVHVGLVMEGRVFPKAEKYAVAAERAAEVYKRFAEDAQTLQIRQFMPDGSIRLFSPREFYLTHYYDQQAVKDILTEGTKLNRNAINHILKNGFARDVKDAKQFLREKLSAPWEFRTGPINRSRIGLLDAMGVKYEQDPQKVMTRYIYSVRKQLELARVFGRDHSGAKALWEQVGDELGNKVGEEASMIYRAYEGALDLKWKPLTRAASTYNILTMLSTSGIVQFAQNINTAALTSYRSLIKAISLYRGNRAEMERWVTSIGAHLNEVVNDMVGGASNPWADFWIRKVIGLEPLDRMNRVIAAVAGRLHAEEVALGLAKAPNSARLARQVERLGLNPAEVIAQKGVLTPTQLRQAGYKVSIDSQFAVQVLDLPQFANTRPAGRIIYQFKSFAYQQAGFIKGLMDEARKGDFAPLLRYTSGMGTVGWTIGKTIQSLKGIPPKDDPIWDYIHTTTMAGTFGLYSDMLTSLTSGRERMQQLILGPAGTEIFNYMDESVNALRGNPKRLGRHIIARVPLIGQPLAHYWYDKL